MRDLALGWISPGALTLTRQSRVFSRGVYTRYPYQANTFGLPPEIAYACVTGFVKAHFAADKPARRASRTSAAPTSATPSATSS